jgi:hypothetical protein
MNKSIFAALFLAGLAAIAPPAVAQGSVYFGGSVGNAESKENACFATGGTVTCDRKGEVAWSAFGGVMFTPNFGIEGGYHNLGKIVEAADATTGDRAWVRTRLGEVVAVGALPWIAGITFYVKGGGYYARSKYTGTFGPAGADSTTKQWTYGAGVSWDVFKHAGLRAEYQRFNNVGGREIGLRTDVDVASLGAYLKF